MFIYTSGFTGLRHKNAIMLHWSNVCVVAILPIITALALVAWLAMTHEAGGWVMAQILQKSMIYIFYAPNVYMDV